ncbi:MAG: tRNA (N(6)-L-threonylcarbamoyladenosine(37)-C(2))-methylthiotransferase MtaB [Defluviitoga tunisiensis]|jgi:threonylcarbamoyladenosine tRNA methylthiotransferase MtaB|nr:tRNA (N(6)-L-threonylcarbamoyladenosine(37)-C(2))-methylthiotransferase MtaB [Defluviitoga tunisiensis]MDY0379803.1 tRNA (N(6)-L-threonylcarbamoyladenosine(37)-C(2))-methylthiotransferase MtaB [Defluviitoga tunisiensis]HHV01064.1 tRNA (N(6)-L-threonylcarbamoyladenosine(37)-C(2))-methylthiotransferase MtaB [Defluviitoga tunisiensis]
MKERISLITFGCKMNQAESQYISEKLSKEFDIIFEEKNGKSDAYILNTCSVTSEAERKVRQTIRRIRKSNKNAKIIAIGCYANSDPLELRSIGANLVLGNLEKKDIELYFDKEGVYSEKFFWLQNDTKILVPEESYGNRTRFFLPIEEGCINGCAFCKIRLLRGTKIISLSKKDIINKIQNLINKGYKEIVLTGTNLTCYGLDNSESFEDLLKTIGDTFKDENIRIRLTSLYPNDVSDNLAYILTNYSIFEKHLHLSIQHFSDRILNLMGRNYKRKDILNSIEKLRKLDSKFSITCDLIVGFPSENEEDLKILFDSVKDLKILKVHGFRFSAREGTLAFKMDNQISGSDKKDRMIELTKNAQFSRKEYLSQLVSSEHTVLIEDVKNGYLLGYDEYYIPHKIYLKNGNCESDFRGIFLKSKIISISEGSEGVISNVL